MAIRDRLRSIGERLQRDEEADRQRASITERARAVLQNSENPQARQRAREILARAQPGTGAGTVDNRQKTRTQQMFDRAERTATMRAPIQANLDPTPDAGGMWAFAMATPQHSGGGKGGKTSPGVDAELSFEHMGEMAEINPFSLVDTPDPDWEDNPDHLDTPGEVRDDLRDSGLNPMNAGTEEEATFGHFLVHSFEDDADLGGRTPAQLEAEHDMAVDAMLDFGVGHDSPMDQERGWFDFDDDWGLSWGDD